MSISRRLVGAMFAESDQTSLPPPSSTAPSLFSATPYTGSGTSQPITTGVNVPSSFSNFSWTVPLRINLQSTAVFMLAVSSNGLWILAGYGSYNQPLVSLDGVTWTRRSSKLHLQTRTLKLLQLL